MLNLVNFLITNLLFNPLINHKIKKVIKIEKNIYYYKPDQNLIKIMLWLKKTY